MLLKWVRCLLSSRGSLVRFVSTLFQAPLRCADWAAVAPVRTPCGSTSPLWVIHATQTATCSTSPTSSLFPLSLRSLEVWQVRHYSTSCAELITLIYIVIYHPISRITFSKIVLWFGAMGTLNICILCFFHFWVCSHMKSAIKITFISIVIHFIAQFTHHLLLFLSQEAHCWQWKVSASVRTPQLLLVVRSANWLMPATLSWNAEHQQ